MRLTNRKKLVQFLTQLDENFTHKGCFYLIGETSLVYEGWRPWAEQLEFTAEIAERNRPQFTRFVHKIERELEIAVLDEHPGDLVPLPEGYQSRALPIDLRLESNARQAPGDGRLKSSLKFYHFDPYSVAFRYIARGDEQDYHLVLAYLEHGWITIEKMDSLLEILLPHFSFQTIQQDPAEFRRKYKGLLQMWRAFPRIQ
jgi:hypothetical protein